MSYEVVSDATRARRFTEVFFPFGKSEHEKGICLLRDGKVQAACIYYDFNGANIWMHHASRPGRRSLTRTFIRESFHYPFAQLHANRISLAVSSINLASIRFVEHLGFKAEATLKGAGQNGVDTLIYVMFREDCRYV